MTPQSGGQTTRLDRLEQRVDDFEERTRERLDSLDKGQRALEVKDGEFLAAIEKISEGIKLFISDSAEGRKVLERMLASIALHRGWLMLMAVATSAPAWFPYVKPWLTQALWGAM